MPNLTKDFIDKTEYVGEYRDDRLSGFLLKIGKDGVKSYQVHGRIKNSEVIRYTIGKHNKPWTSKSAREEAERLLHLMKLGIDPRDELKQQANEREAQKSKDLKAKLRTELTLENVFHQWVTEDRKTKVSTKKLYKQVIFKHLRDWLDMPLASIDESMCSDRYNEIADKTIASANNCFRALRMLFNWTIDKYENQEQPISKNPVVTLSKRDQWQVNKPKRDIINDADLKVWYAALQRLENESFHDYFLLLLLTGLRKVEAASLCWTDIDLRRATLTARDTKNGTDHELPLTDYLRSLFERRAQNSKGEKYVFPAQGMRGYIWDVTQYQNKIFEDCSVRFTPHSLRRTFSYAAARERLGESERKALLNHLENADVTQKHYSPWMTEDLKEPLELVGARLLRLMSVDATSRKKRASRK